MIRLAVFLAAAAAFYTLQTLSYAQQCVFGDCCEASKEELRRCAMYNTGCPETNYLCTGGDRPNPATGKCARGRCLYYGQCRCPNQALDKTCEPVKCSNFHSPDEVPPSQPTPPPEEQCVFGDCCEASKEELQRCAMYNTDCPETNYLCTGGDRPNPATGKCARGRCLYYGQCRCPNQALDKTCEPVKCSNFHSPDEVPPSQPTPPPEEQCVFGDCCEASKEELQRCAMYNTDCPETNYLCTGGSPPNQATGKCARGRCLYYGECRCPNQALDDTCKPVKCPNFHTPGDNTPPTSQPATAQESPATSSSPSGSGTQEPTASSVPLPSPTSSVGSDEGLGAPNASPLPSTTQVTSPGGGGESGGSNEGIAEIVGSTAGVLALISPFFIWLWRRRKKKRKMEREDNNGEENSGPGEDPSLQLE